MNIFLDTSSLFKLYQNEVGTIELKLFLETKTIEKIFLSNITRVEFNSAIYKKFRKKEIYKNDVSEILNEFNIHVLKNYYTMIPINDELILEAKFLLGKYGEKGLRALDAIQFASAAKVKSEVSKFFTHDNLLQIFFKEEFKEI